MLKFRTRPRISESVRIGPFRFRVSEPLGRRGRGWGSVGTRVGRHGWLSWSTPLGRGRAGARARGRRRR
jgi:hypothetical protein